jgi:hypothetical protein
MIKRTPNIHPAPSRLRTRRVLQIMGSTENCKGLHVESAPARFMMAGKIGRYEEAVGEDSIGPHRGGRLS